MADATTRGDQPSPPPDVEVPGSGPGHRRAGTAALTFGALGVVFGDIGTSPLYALQTVFHADHGAVDPVRADVFGVISLVFWSVTAVVSLKYVTFIMRADNDGEGGIMALIALVRQTTGTSRRAKVTLVALGIFGASLFYGDGMITPAISVLSAVEGLEVVSPSLKSVVVPIALAVLAVLFAVQRFGTGAVGRLFGPVMAGWFSLLAVLGLAQVVQHPAIVGALSPSYGVAFIADHPATAFIALGAIVLAITGAEALYADMGHFGRRPIRRAWFVAVFPALTLNYLGQGALIVQDPTAVDNPFYLLVPHWGRIPMVVLATMATVIASQAVISGAFSVTRQAIQLGFLPRLTVRHTSRSEAGQVYAPLVNWTILAAVIGLVVGFGSSAALASAYGIAVTGTLAIDTILFFTVVRTRWRRSLKLTILGAAAFLTVDLTFLAANLTKVLKGGWFPLLIALVVFTVLMTWQRGRELVTARRIEAEGPLRDYVAELRETDAPVRRVPGTAVFLHVGKETTPLALRANVEHNHALHDTVVILSVEVQQVPYVPDDDRLAADDLGFADDGITHLHVRYGFQQTPNVPGVLGLARDRGCFEGRVEVEGASYFLSRMTILTTDDAAMAGWRKRLFVTMARNAASPADYFCLPVDRTVTMGSTISF